MLTACVLCMPKFVQSAGQHLMGMRTRIGRRQRVEGRGEGAGRGSLNSARAPTGSDWSPSDSSYSIGQEGQAGHRLWHAHRLRCMRGGERPVKAEALVGQILRAWRAACVPRRVPLAGSPGTTMLAKRAGSGVPCARLAMSSRWKSHLGSGRDQVSRAARWARDRGISTGPWRSPWWASWRKQGRKGPCICVPVRARTRVVQGCRIVTLCLCIQSDSYRERPFRPWLTAVDPSPRHARPSSYRARAVQGEDHGGGTLSTGHVLNAEIARTGWSAEFASAMPQLTHASML